MPGAIRPDTLRISDRHKILKMSLAGTPQQDIATALGITQGQISRELKKINLDLDVIRKPRLEWESQLATLQMVAQELLEAWENSKGEQVSTLETTDGDGERHIVTKREFSHGDTRYLKELQRVLKRMADLNGVDAHIRNRETRDSDPMTRFMYGDDPPPMFAPALPQRLPGNDDQAATMKNDFAQVIAGIDQRIALELAALTTG
jgi:hypothetical protein